MGLFDRFKKSNRTESIPVKRETGQLKDFSDNSIAISDRPIPEKDKKYYQSDNYYTKKAFEGTVFEKKVITFEERKKISFPSNTGLYVAEILLLSYCDKGQFPCPANGYQGFWWFEYGVRNVGAVLSSLEERGYIYLRHANDCVGQLTIPKLKTILKDHDLSISGNKADLLSRVAENISEEVLLSAGVTRKYALTEKGKSEINENAYVPFMHANPNKSRENVGEVEFNVWSINRILGKGDKSDWKKVIDAEEKRVKLLLERHNVAWMEQLKTFDPEKYQLLQLQDDQLALVKSKKDEYARTGDLDSYIAFWEQLWRQGGLIFEGSMWHFELADLYIKQKRFDDALAFLRMLREKKPSYSEKADVYIEKIVNDKCKHITKEVL